MDAKEQLLERLESLKKRTEEFGQALQEERRMPGERNRLKDEWMAIAQETAITNERKAVQAKLRLNVVHGRYPLILINVAYGRDGHKMRLLVHDLILLGHSVGMCWLEVSRKAVDPVLTQLYGDDHPEPDEAGHIVAHWYHKAGPFSKDPDEKVKYRDWKLPALPPKDISVDPSHHGPKEEKKEEQKKPEEGSLPKPIQSMMSDGQAIGEGLKSLGKSIETASENAVAAAIFAPLLGSLLKRRR